MIELVLADMDNTLLPSGEKNVSYRAITAIRELLELGVRFGPATGRDPFELDRMFFGARDCYATGIMANGKRIYVDGELRQYTLIDNGALSRLVDMLEDAPNCFVTTLAFEKPSGKDPYRCIGAREGDKAWFEQNIGFRGRSVSKLPDEEIIAATIACAGTQAQLDAVLERAREVAPEFDFVQPTEHWVDIVPSGLNKGSALPLLLRELGIASDEVLFFGDAGNDVALMGSVENSVAVANATPDAAAAAKWHIGPCDDDAVAQALEELADALRTGETPRFMREEYQVVVSDDSDDDELEGEDFAAAIRALAFANHGPELGGEAGPMRGAGADAQ